MSVEQVFAPKVDCSHRRGIEMAYFPFAMRIWLVIVAITTLLPAVRGEEFVSDQYGFRFTVPAGFRERADNTTSTVKMFVEEDKTVPGDALTIYIQHLGQEINPSHEITPDELPRKEGWTFSLGKWHWQKSELQIIRREGNLAPNAPFVGFLIQFPLKDEAVQILVQGPTSREPEVLKVFEESVQSFANLKPYIVRVERVQPGRATHAVTQFVLKILPPTAIGALLIFWFVRIRNSQAKPTATAESD
jgi:hypothetical protein